MNNGIWSFLDYVEDIAAGRPLRHSSNLCLKPFAFIVTCTSFLLFLHTDAISILHLLPIKRRTGYAWNCFLKYSRAVYDNPYIAVADKVRFLKAEVLEVMLYGCMSWTLSPGDFDKLREAHRGMLLRCLIAYTSTRAAPDYQMLSYLEVLLRIDCECIEATVMTRILHYADRVARMHDDRLPNIVMRGEMDGGKRKRGQPRNASNTVSRNTALPSKSTSSVGCGPPKMHLSGTVK